MTAWSLRDASKEAGSSLTKAPRQLSAGVLGDLALLETYRRTAMGALEAGRHASVVSPPKNVVVSGTRDPGSGAVRIARSDHRRTIE
jgi:hypothetical protein